jgi:hypothetical protein
MFMRAADSEPAMFERGREFANSPQGLSDQFGTSPVLYPNRGSKLADLMDYQIRSDPAARYAAFPERDPAMLEGRAQSLVSILGDAPENSVLSLRDAGLLSNTKLYHMWNTQGLSKGSGQGTALYPSAFGHLRNQGQSDVNMSGGLSGDNQLRRNYAQASAILRDPSMAQQILVDPSQLSRLPPGVLKSSEFHRMSPEQQVGVLQLSGAQGALNAMRQAIESNAKRLEPDTFTTSDPQRAIYRSMAARADAQMPPALERFLQGEDAKSPASARTLARAYQQSPFAMPVGPRALTKLGVVDDTLRDAGLSSLSDRFPGLEYASGGSV